MHPILKFSSDYRISRQIPVFFEVGVSLVVCVHVFDGLALVIGVYVVNLAQLKDIRNEMGMERCNLQTTVENTHEDNHREHAKSPSPYKHHKYTAAAK